MTLYMFLNERGEGRKKEASKVKQTNKAKQHSTPKAVTFPRKNEHVYTCMCNVRLRSLLNGRTCSMCVCDITTVLPPPHIQPHGNIRVKFELGEEKRYVYICTCTCIYMCCSGLLFDLACFFLPSFSHLSLKHNIHVHITIHF